MANYQSLRVAQSQFGMSKASIESFKASPEGAEMLIPLTEALYVPATIASNKKVLVEYGAGYFVERNCEDAEGFFDRKVKFLSERTGQLEMTIRQKREQLAQVIQIYQMKVKMAAEQAGSQASQ
jgi:prefoldin alpha subunit|tara:strand:- start:56 stop:427 length:372 start_codon:yes stop_codon:yes gene_type:complete